MVPRYEKIIHMNSLMDRNYLIVYIPEIYDTTLDYQQLNKVIVKTIGLTVSVTKSIRSLFISWQSFLLPELFTVEFVNRTVDHQIIWGCLSIKLSKSNVTKAGQIPLNLFRPFLQ